KSGGGQRLYTRREIDTILRIKELLYRDGFTIAGAKKKLEEVEVVASPAAASAGEAPAAPTAGAIASIKRELNAILEMLGD
ncbi:MAG TPA: MerR family transcriptional regulator, partial [Thermoanaerobaculia bacterium]|nr:MerR family transcriptional regulator [Thermoanaerobaculia bacterium]